MRGGESFLLKWGHDWGMIYYERVVLFIKMQELFIIRQVVIILFPKWGLIS